MIAGSMGKSYVSEVNGIFSCMLALTTPFARRIHSHFEMRFCFVMSQFRMSKFKVVSS